MQGPFEDCLGIDLAPGAIEIAKREAAAAGFSLIRYEVGDLNTLTIEPASFDAVWFNGSLHHVEALERLLPQVAQALTPQGFLFANEYVGARRFAFPPRQREAIIACNSLIPPGLRRVKTPDGKVYVRLAPQLPDPAAVQEVDPSEAVRSDDILRVVDSLFHIVQCRQVGGSILQFLLEGIAWNFQGNDADAERVLDLLPESRTLSSL